MKKLGINLVHDEELFSSSSVLKWANQAKAIYFTLQWRSLSLLSLRIYLDPWDLRGLGTYPWHFLQLWKATWTMGRKKETHLHCD